MRTILDTQACLGWSANVLPSWTHPHSLIMEVLESWSYQNVYCGVNIHILCEQQCFYIFNSVVCVFSNIYICRIFILQFILMVFVFGCRKRDNPRRTLCRLCVGFTILCCCLPQCRSTYLFTYLTCFYQVLPSDDPCCENELLVVALVRLMTAIGHFKTNKVKRWNSHKYFFKVKY